MLGALVFASWLAAASGAAPESIFDAVPSVRQAPTSRAVAAAASYATTGTGLAMIAGFTYLLATSAFTLPMGSTVTGVSVAFLLVNFGPNVGDLLNGDLVRFGAHGGLRLLMVAISVVFPYALLGWVASIVVDLRDAGDAPVRWAQRSRLESFGSAKALTLPVVALEF
jgi:hypothetical protein